jgi:hypothetical protein
MIRYSSEAVTHWEGTECICFHGKWGYSSNHSRAASQLVGSCCLLVQVCKRLVGQRPQKLVAAQREIQVVESSESRLGRRVQFPTCQLTH